MFWEDLLGSASGDVATVSEPALTVSQSVADNALVPAMAVANPALETWLPDTALTVGQTAGDNTLAPMWVSPAVQWSQLPGQWWETVTQVPDRLGTWGTAIGQGAQAAGGRLADWALKNPQQALALGITGGTAIANAFRDEPTQGGPSLPPFSPMTSPVPPVQPGPAVSPLLRGGASRTMASPTTPGPLTFQANQGISKGV